MKILMIGNGFDREHGLPTDYKQFLAFIHDFKNKSNKTFEFELNKKSKENNSKGYFEMLLEEHKDKKTKLEALIEGNVWVEYLEEIQNYDQDSWVGFEGEISKVIQLLESAREEYYQQVKIDTQNIEETVSKKILDKVFSKCPALEDINDACKFYFLCKTITREKYLNAKARKLPIIGKRLYKTCYAKDIFTKWNKKLISDLDRLIEAFEFYLYDYVYNIEITKNNVNILDIIGARNSDVPRQLRVLSFNYTDTLDRIYGKLLKTDNVEYHYIHGKVREDYEQSNNMVLGIDEYLISSQRSNNVDFIKFQKYFQRIQKRTGSNYKKWLESIEKENEPTNLYIFGHSLDVTDKEIIEELILNKHIITTVFYYDQDTYEKLVANLIKIIGRDELIRKVSGSKPTIIFEKQGDSITVKNNG